MDLSDGNVIGTCVTLSVAVIVWVPAGSQFAAAPVAVISRSSERGKFEFGVVTPFSGSRKLIEPSIGSVKKYLSWNPLGPTSCLVEIVVGAPGPPTGS